MQIDVSHPGSFALATLRLAPHESARAEGGAMVAMSTDMRIETKAQGGLLRSLGRSALGGESFFLNTFTAGPSGGLLQLAPNLPGDVTVLDPSTVGAYLVHSGSYLGSDPDVDVKTKWGGARGFFAAHDLVLLHCSGGRQLIVSSYGAIDHFALGPGEAVTIDTGHVVAFSENIGYSTRKVGGLKSTLLSGEGLVCDFRGPGEVLMQTRNLGALAEWVREQVPTQRN